ncbi:hypothetical protein ACFLYI_02385 [Chloroflexota bacterium]
MSVDWKSRFKKTFKARLVIAGLIFAVVGWFLLGVMLLGRFFEEELLEIEEFVQSTAFTWGLRTSILGAVIILIRKNERLTKVLQNKRIRLSLYIFYGVGFIGWLWGIIDLLA